MLAGKPIVAMAILAAAVSTAGCTTIKENRGYIVDQSLVDAIQPGIDNQQSVESTLGRPTFTSQFGQPTWYYVSNLSERKPFRRPKIKSHDVLAVRFDAAGNVVSADRSGIDKVVYLSPDGDSTPTLGRERSFFQDLFGNIGAVGAGGAGPGGNGSNTGS